MLLRLASWAWIGDRNSFDQSFQLREPDIAGRTDTAPSSRLRQGNLCWDDEFSVRNDQLSMSYKAATGLGPCAQMRVVPGKVATSYYVSVRVGFCLGPCWSRTRLAKVRQSTYFES